MPFPASQTQASSRWLPRPRGWPSRKPADGWWSLRWLVVLAGGEVLGAHLVEEVLEFLDDLLGVLDLVLELDRGLLDHVVGGEDGGRRADGEGDGVGGAGVDVDRRTVHRDRDLRIERVVAKLGHGDALAFRVELVEHLREEIV